MLFLMSVRDNEFDDNVNDMIVMMMMMVVVVIKIM